MDKLQRKAAIIREEVLLKAEKFILVAITSKLDNGKHRTKEILFRKTHSQLLPDVVIVIPIYFAQDQKYLVLTRQFREATKTYSIAFPAGKTDLTDKSVSEAAGRELVEETTFQVSSYKEGDYSTLAYSSDGCLGETFAMVHFRVEPKKGTTIEDVIGPIKLAKGPTKLSETEDIETLLIPFDKYLLNNLRTLQIWNNDAVDGRLMSFAFSRCFSF